MTSSASSSDSGLRVGSGPVLILGAAEDPAQAVLAASGKVLGQVEVPGPGRTMALLPPAVEGLLAGSGLCPRDLAGVACDLGPGSFTGLRAAAALVQGLALGLGLPMAGLERLSLLARAARQGGAVWAAIRARRDQVFLQGFATQPGAAPRALGPAEALSTPAAAARLVLARQDGPLTLVGGAAVVFRQELASVLPGDVFPDPPLTRPRPEDFALAAAEAAWSRFLPPPLYLRPSDAEENLAAIARGRGLEPEQAETTLRRLTARLPE